MQQLETILKWMQRNDPNGDYYSILYELENNTLTLQEIIPVLINTIAQWRSDINVKDRNNQQYKNMLQMEINLAAML